MTLAFTRATRASVPLKIGISGPSGSGKTTAALKLARGLVGPDAPIAFLDTENGSGSLYADITAFDTLDMNPPYQVAKFLAALETAVEHGYKALIIDSASHEWLELLNEKEALDARGGNTYANWAPITKKHDAFLAAIRNAPIHVICCLRGKEKHEINEKKAVVKLGMGSQMRDGFEFELTVAFDVAMDHNAKTSKDRTRLFDGRLEQITEATGRELANWLTSGATLAPNDPLPQRDMETPIAEALQEVADAKRASAPAVSQEASDFVDEVSPATASAEDSREVLDLALKHKVNTDQLLQYAASKGWAPGQKPNWMAITPEGVKTLVKFLSDDTKRRGLQAHLLSHFPMAKTA